MKSLTILYTFILCFLLSTLSVAQQFSVLLDPGHRNTPNDCGAPSSCGGYCEADLVLDFAIFGYSEIDFNPNCDFDPFQTRQGSQSRTLQQRVDMANNTSGFEVDAYNNPIPTNGVNFFFSIHANSEGNGTASGTEIFYYDYTVGDPNANNDPTRSLYSHRSASMGLAAYIYETYPENSLADWRGVKDDTQSAPETLKVLRETNMPAVLLETGFISNYQECQNMQTTSYLWAAGDGIERAVCYIAPDSPEGWVEYVIDSDRYIENIILNDGDGMLVENTNNGNLQSHEMFSSYLQFNQGSFVVVEPNTWLVLDEYSTLQNNGGVVFLAPGAEIITNNLFEFVQGNIFFGGLGSGLSIKPTGTMQISNNQTLNVNNKGVIIHDGGLLKLMDNAQLIFDSGSTVFKIRPGSTIKLGHKARIQVNSKLEVEGSAAEEPIIFTSLYQNPTPQQYWSWLKIVGEGEDDPSVFKYATVEYADYGLYAYNANVIIENNTIQNNRYFNLYLDNCDADIANNTIQNAEVYDGIFLTGSSPELYGNFISGNSGSGVYCYDYSSPNFGFDMTGNNIIVGNDVGVFARQYSNPFLGDAEAGTGGDNSIYSNVSYAVKAIEYCNILAQSNWWGDYPPSEEWFYADERSYIDYSYALENDPNEEMMEGTFGNTPEGYESSRGSGADSLLRLARKYRFQKRPQLAIGIYRQLINKHGNTISARWGLVEILSAFKEARLDSSVNFLQRIKTTHSNGEVKRIANDMLTASLLRKGSISAAVSNCQEILLQYPGTESEKLALFELFNIQLNIVQDSLQARGWLTILEQKYPDDKLTMIAQYQMGGSTVSNKVHLTTATSTSSETSPGNEHPQTFRLDQNYPNPFNPATNITFTISKPRLVELKIYDMTGRQVRKLVSETKASGNYNVEWDGADDEG